MVGRYALFSTSVSSMYHDIQKIERTEMGKMGLKGPHAQCLIAIGRFPEGVTAAQLCEICGKDKAAVSREVSELERAGMVARKTPNGIRYRSRLVLTEQGLDAVRRISARAQIAVEQASAGLSEEQVQMFLYAVALISGNLHTICRDGLH